MQLRRNEKGSFLVEVLASMALLSLALLAGAPMFTLATHENAAASDLTLSTTAAHDMAEKLKDEYYELLTSGMDEVKLRSMVFTRTWVVEEDTPHPSMKTVTVTVVPHRSNPYGTNRVASIRFYRIPTR